MKKIAIVLTVICLMAFKPEVKDKVLIFSLTKGYHHLTITDGIIAIQKLGAENNFDVDTTTNAAKFTDDNLKNYKALIFLSPTGDDLFNADQQLAFQNYIHHGGGYVGIHAATDCLFTWEWYGKLVGAYFTKHPKIQQATLNVVDKTNISTKMLPTTWSHTDEWYNFKDVNPDIKVLISVDEKTYTGGEMNGNHPISWYHKFEGGRVFYTALGHTKEDYATDTLFIQHILGGIKYALGRKK